MKPDRNLCSRGKDCAVVMRPDEGGWCEPHAKTCTGLQDGLKVPTEQFACATYTVAATA
jgi:hypothetical protein